MTLNEKRLCDIWDKLKKAYPHVPDNRLMKLCFETYNNSYNGDMTSTDVINALEARANT